MIPSSFFTYLKITRKDYSNDDEVREMYNSLSVYWGVFLYPTE